jgi:hypothetical protein
MSGSMPYIAPGERFVLHAIKYTSQSAAVRPNQCFDWSGLLSFGQVTPKAFSTNSIPRVSEVGSFAVNSLRDAGLMGTIRPVGRQDEWCRRLHAKPVTETSSGIRAPTHFTFSVQPERCFAAATLTCVGAPLQRERRSVGRFLFSGTYREPCTSAYLHHTMTRLAFANKLTLFEKGRRHPAAKDVY